MLLHKNLLHSNLFNYSLNYVDWGNILINAQRLERKNSLKYMCINDYNHYYYQYDTYVYINMLFQHENLRSKN